jgi:predicted ribosome quality control (RQC) complex YloA/Tae2 family protein
VVNANGKLGVAPSSKRFKDQIKPMDKESESILALKPVTFRYKQQIDANRIPQFGLVAEDVAKVNPDLVIRDREGKPYTVRYDAVNAMLLNEFIKEHQTVQKLKATSEKQQTTIALQEAQIKSLTASLKEQATQIDKVSAQLEMIRPTPQVVENR